MTIIDINASAKIRAAIDAGKLKSGSWGNGNSTVCMMSAIVAGAGGESDCVTAGWPAWLARLNVYLFDADVYAVDESVARNHFALRIAELVQSSRDYDRALDLFLIRRLDTGDHSALKSLRLNPVDSDWWRDCVAAVARVADLVRRRLAGEDVVDEMNAAYAAARAADARAAYAAARAADARAAYAAYATARAADAAAAARAFAAAYAYAAARADLIQAIEESSL